MSRQSACMVLAVVCLSGADLLYAASGEGVGVGGFRIVPSGEAKAIYDSNVKYASENATGDVSFVGKAALNVTNTAEIVKLKVGAWGLIQRFVDMTEENHEDWGQSLSLSYSDRDKAQVGLRESYESIRSLDYGVGEIQTRDNFNIDLSGSKDFTDKVDADGAYAYKSTKYQSPSSFDWDEHSVKAEGSHRVTDKSAVLVSLKAGSQSSDGNTDDGKYVSMKVGGKTKGTDKVNVRAALGWIVHDSANDISMVNFDVGTSWDVTEKITLSLNGNNGVEPATQERNNYNIITRADASARWEFEKGISTTFTVRYNRNDYDQKVDVDGVLCKKTDDTFTGVLNLTYLPPVKNMDVYVEAKYEDKNAPAAFSANAYDQFSTVIGMNLRY